MRLDFPRSFYHERFWPIHPPELFKVSATKYWERVKKSGGQNRLKSVLGKLKERLPPYLYRRICASLAFQYQYSYQLFPYFRLLVGEFLNEEWLSLIDFRKPFHRDHIYHQPQVAILAKALMDSIKIPDGGGLRLGKTLAKGNRVSLLRIAARQLAVPNPGNAYLHAFCKRIGIPEEFYRMTPKEPPIPVHFWSEVIHDATITASLFHDIGYPFQFHSHISSDLDALTRTDLRSFIDGDRNFYEMRGRLLMSALAGYRDYYNYPLPCGHDESLFKLFKDASSETHGLPGALSFLYLKDIISDFERKSEDPVGLLKTEMAAMAIMMHDMHKIYADTHSYNHGHNIEYYLYIKNSHLRLFFSKDPVSFIVTLADLIQDYQRTNIMPRMVSEDYKEMHYEAEEIITRSQILFNTDHRILTIKHYYDPSSPSNIIAMHRHKHDFNKKVYTQYFEKQFGYLEYKDLFTDIRLEAYPDAQCH